MPYHTATPTNSKLSEYSHDISMRICRVGSSSVYALIHDKLAKSGVRVHGKDGDMQYEYAREIVSYEYGTWYSRDRII